MIHSTRGVSILVVAWLGVASAVWADVQLELDYRYDTTGFFAPDSDARASLEAAGRFYESILDDDLTAIYSGTENHFDGLVNRPDTGEEATLDDLDVPADTLFVFVGARDLGGNVLGWGGPNGWNASYQSQSWIDNVQTRGEGAVADTQGSTATDFAPWGGTLTIDIDTNWNAKHTLTPKGSQRDLSSVILHELGHVFGIGTADSWDNLNNGSDQFTGAASVASYGGNVPLQSGGMHWDSGTMSTIYAGGPVQETAMDPEIIVGTRKLMTHLDLAGLDDLGWDINPVAEWLEPAGGPFETPGHWSTSTKPTARDTAQFRLADTYTVTLSGEESNRQALVDRGNVTFDLGSQTYTVDYLIVSTTGASLHVSGGTMRVLNQAMVASGTSLAVDAGGTLRLDGTLEGSLTINSGGTLTGAGPVEGNVTNAGRLSPGNSAAAMTITGSYVQESTGKLEIELGGLEQGTQYDQVAISGNASLDGELEIVLFDDFQPSPSDTFAIISFGSRSGEFSTITGDVLPGGVRLVPLYGSTTLTLQAQAVIAGDANLDGEVTDQDAAILATHWQQSGATWADGDFNGDGQVTDQDAAILATHWQQGTEGVFATVPEPTPLVLLLGVPLFLVLSRGCRNTLFAAFGFGW